MPTYRITLAVDGMDLPEVVKLLTSAVERGVVATQFLIERDAEPVKQLAPPAVHKSYKRPPLKPGRSPTHRVEILANLIREKGAASWKEMKEALVANGLKATSVNSTFGSLRKHYAMHRGRDGLWRFDVAPEG